MKFLDVFTGMGGLTLAAQQAGMTPVAFCEKDKIARQLLTRHWPDIPIFEDATNPTQLITDLSGRLDLITGGDPCPCRSAAARGSSNKAPDLSGYLLAIIGGIHPRWVVRENVPAPDVIDFCLALELLGYRCVIAETNADSITGQNRERDFIVGASKEAWPGLEDFVCKFEESPNRHCPQLKTRQVVPCLTVERWTYDPGDCFIWEEKLGLRILDAAERRAFAGFPQGWLDGISETACARLTGNAVVPGAALPIFKGIMEVEQLI